MGNKLSSQKSRLTDEEICVLKANTKLSEKEIRQFYENFKKECPSGKMNKQQFLKFYKVLDPDENDADTIYFTFSMFDKNGDDTVDFSEFVLAIGLINKEDLDSQLELCFSMIDTSGDGSITFQEMVNFLNYGVKKLAATGEQYDDDDPSFIAAMVFDVFGLNKTQKLNKSQFIEGCKTNEDLKQMFF